MINWKAVLIGFFLTVILALILNPIIGEYGSYISIIIAGIIVGYIVNRNKTNGAVHGALVAILGGLFAFIILFILGGLLIIKAEILSF
ncbi:MAG: DUF5518 domain-containing protein, partial [Methanobacterium sp.]